MTPGDEANRRRERCPLCDDRGILADAPCLRGCPASLPYYASLPPSREAERLAAQFKMAVMLA